jgi:dihydrofolate synthase/folylpolyglutamate synthase
LDYKATLEYLFSHLPMYQRIGKAAYKKDLTNTLALCKHLGDPQHQFPAIHIAGTNGKGSVSHFLSAIFQSAGYKTGLYVSPHYKDFRERIKINGQYITRKFVTDFVRDNRSFLDELQPSFFEMTVGLAFQYFADQKVDIAIIETGLGGRLDSTNILTPEISIITNISYDHMNMLGDTLPLIAFEKAGIIKNKVPVVIGETHPDSKDVFLEVAAERQAPVIFADQHFVCTPLKTTGSGFICDIFKNGQLAYHQLEVDAFGSYQYKNLVTTLQAVELLKEKWRITDAVVRQGLSQLRNLTRFMGRWQIIGHQPLIICDSAHNEAGIREAMVQLSQVPAQRLHIVLGFVNDKSISDILPLFPQHAVYYFAKANIPRGLEATILKENAAQAGLSGKAYSSVRQALKAAKRKASPEDVIFVGGSIFVVGEVL